MKAVILAGGKGTRLAPYTTVFPKPMLPIGGKPILEIIIKQLALYGFKTVVLSVGYLAEIIQAYFRSNGDIPEDVTIRYVREKKPLGTAAPVALIPDLDESFLVMNGDILTTLDYSELMAFHKANGALLTIAVCSKKVKMNLGIVEFGDDKRVTGYVEKPTYTFNDSMGIYVYEPKVINYITPGVYMDLPTLIHRLLENGEKVLAYHSTRRYYWIDMGRHEDYEEAQIVYEKRKDEFVPNRGRIEIRPIGKRREREKTEMVID